MSFKLPRILKRLNANHYAKSTSMLYEEYLNLPPQKFKRKTLENIFENINANYSSFNFSHVKVNVTNLYKHGFDGLADVVNRTILLDEMKYIKNLQFKKVFMIYVFMHERRHFSQLYSRNKIFTDYEKFMALEAHSEIKSLQYSYRLRELDARIFAIKNLNERIAQNIVPRSLETWLVMLKVYSEVLSVVANDKDKLQFSPQCTNNIIEKYKNYTKLLNLTNVNFEKLQEEINEQFQYVFNSLQITLFALYIQLQQNPEVCKQLQISKQALLKLSLQTITFGEVKRLANNAYIWARQPQKETETEK